MDLLKKKGEKKRDIKLKREKKCSPDRENGR